MAGRWEEVTIDGKSADVYQPSNSQTPATNGVLFLHGHGRVTLKNNTAYTDCFEEVGWPVICPHGQRSWWLSTLCSEFDKTRTPIAYIRESVIPYFQQEWGIQPPHIALLGISMGGQGALQVAYRHAREFPNVVAISPMIDFDKMYGRDLPLDDMFSSAEAARQQTVTLHLHPLNWPRNQLIVCDPTDKECFEGVERLASKLYSSGIPFESDLQTTVNGHHWDYFNEMAKPAVAFLRERMDQ